jgi:hypothetical protein
MQDPIIINPTRKENSDAFGHLHVTRLAPGNHSLKAEFFKGSECGAVYAEATSINGGECRRQELPGNSSTFELTDLVNGIDYILKLTSVKNGEITAKAPARYFRCGVTPGIPVNYIHPEDYTYMPSGRSPASPSLLKLNDSRLLASHDVFWNHCGQNLSMVFASDDNGINWSHMSQISPCFWGKLFCHQNRVYMLGTSTEYGDLVIFKSEDGGHNWSTPSFLLAGGNAEKGGVHKAPMPVTSCRGRLWTCIDYGSWEIGGFGNGFISIDENEDLMDASKWTCTGFLMYNPDWPGACHGRSEGCLEGNAVVSPDGRLFNLLRYETRECEPKFDKAIILEADPSNPADLPCFFKVIDFPGNLSKFTVGYDAASGRYYSLVNRITMDDAPQRNILSLTSSEDLLNWRIERDVLNYAENGWYEDVGKVGFQYADWQFDGEDIIFLSRTAINGAYSFHNANYLTFHRIKGYRSATKTS